jgi:hypothetical protein
MLPICYMFTYSTIFMLLCWPEKIDSLLYCTSSSFQTYNTPPRLPPSLLPLSPSFQTRAPPSLHSAGILVKFGPLHSHLFTDNKYGTDKINRIPNINIYSTFLVLHILSSWKVVSSEKKGQNYCQLFGLVLDCGAGDNFLNSNSSACFEHISASAQNCSINRLVLQ